MLPVPTQPGGSARESNRVARTETVTVLFTDLASSTELADSLGHAAYETLRTAHFDALRAAAKTHNGTEVKTTGDGLMVCFASVGDAVACAAAMQQAAERRRDARHQRCCGLRRRRTCTN